MMNIYFSRASRSKIEQAAQCIREAIPDIGKERSEEAAKIALVSAKAIYPIEAPSLNKINVALEYFKIELTEDQYLFLLGNHAIKIPGTQALSQTINICLITNDENFLGVSLTISVPNQKTVKTAVLINNNKNQLV